MGWLQSEASRNGDSTKAVWGEEAVQMEDAEENKPTSCPSLLK